MGTRGSFARELAHPIPLVAVLVLVVNDHALKGSSVLPGWVTGKLSDVAGLFFFPVLLVALGRLVVGEPRARALLPMLASAATALGFSAVKLVVPVNAIVARTWGAMSTDATDLLALPSVALAFVWMVRRDPCASLARAWHPVAVVAAAWASVATSAVHPPPVPRPPPTARETAFAERCMHFGTPTMQIVDGIAIVRIPIAVISDRARATVCRVAVRNARLRFVAGKGADAVESDVAARAGATMDLPREQTGNLELAFVLPGPPPECTGAPTLKLEAEEARDTPLGPYDVALGVSCAAR